MRLFSYAILLNVVLLQHTLFSQQTDSEASFLTMPINILNQTAGGTQHWTDHAWKNGFRVQQNVLTKHWRVLDPSDRRVTWGSRETCDTYMAEQIADLPSDAVSPKRVTILLHGLMRTHHSMKPIENDLADRDDMQIIRFSYASSRASIAEHAAALRELIEGLPSDVHFNFVGHSMGNIVVRYMIGDLNREGDPQQILPRCEAMVMLGPPNQGALIARRLATNGVYGWVTGQGGLELGRDWEDFQEKLATPAFPFAIVAGDISDASLQNPLVDGAGDFVVSIEEAKLEGAEAFHTVPVLHSFLMTDPTARKFTIDFLDSHQKAN